MRGAHDEDSAERAEPKITAQIGDSMGLRGDVSLGRNGKMRLGCTALRAAPQMS